MACIFGKIIALNFYFLRLLLSETNSIIDVNRYLIAFGLYQTILKKNFIVIKFRNIVKNDQVFFLNYKIYRFTIMNHHTNSII